MRPYLFVTLLLGAGELCAQKSESALWNTVKAESYELHTTLDDASLVSTLNSNLDEGSRTITAFFHHDFLTRYDVFVFPHRNQLDAQWQKDWGAPDFKSECWMVASGVAHRLDLLSPNAWAAEACEHNAADHAEVQRLITHELVHVYHGQHNPVPDFTGLDDLAWLIEGVATYASGQLDEKRMVGVRKLVAENKAPKQLAAFWRGKEKYGLAGSLVKFVDEKIGRDQLFELLKETRQESVLKKLNLTEEQLIEEWRKSIQ